MDNNFFTPVVVTVCNRVNHIERCLNSLINCNGFEKTDVYIAVDYPPNTAYEEGYFQVKKLLYERYSQFSNMHIILRSENVGALDNMICAIDYLLDECGYEKYICLEDDSEVSPNFLQFCNVCLFAYKNNNEVYGICGSSQVWYGKGFVEDTHETSDYLRKMPFVWHGFATWKNRYQEIIQFCDEFDNVFKIKNLIKIHNECKCFFYSLVSRRFSNPSQLPWKNNIVYPIDFVWDIFMILHEKYIIFPTINKVRDWGMDGSGVNFNTNEDKDMLISGMYLDTDFTFDIINDIPLNDKKEIQRHNKFGCPKLPGKLKRLIILILYKLRIIKI